MSIDRMHIAFAQFSQDFSLDVLATATTGEILTESLAAEGKLSQRRAALMPRFVFWLVITMCIIRDRSIPDVFSCLIAAGRKVFPWLPYRLVTDGAIAHARNRLGWKVFARFFRTFSRRMRRTPWFYGFSPCALDGVCETMPDTEANCAVFPIQKTGRGRAAWPQVRKVALVDVASRTIVDAAMSDCHTGEQSLGRQLWDSLSSTDLLLGDRGFHKSEDFWRLGRMGKHFLCRMSETAKPKIIKELGPGDYLVEVIFRRPLEPGEVVPRKRGPIAQTVKERVTLRMVEYRIKGSKERYRLITNVFNRDISVEAFAELYHWRWDSELAFDEIKTHMMTVHQGKQHTIFRSKNPDLVRQEFWAMLIAYNLIRGLMCAAARKAAQDPLELSFTESLHLIRDSIPRIQAEPIERLPKLYKRFMSDLAECRIDRPRRKRVYPRVIKVKMSNFGVKRIEHKGSKLVVEIVLPPEGKLVA